MDPTSYNFTFEEFAKISQRLEVHHAVFNKLWQLGKPLFVNDINTAAIQFDSDGEVVNFYLNPEFWSKLSIEQKDFVICHECMHVILDHGTRLKNSDNKDIANIATDLVINEMLVNRLGFLKEEVDPNSKYYWINNTFTNSSVKKDKTFEYYYNLLNNCANSGKGLKVEIPGEDGSGGAGQPQLVDDHSAFIDNDLEPLFDQLSEGLSDSEKGSLGDMVHEHFEQDEKTHASRGTVGGNGWLVIKPEKVKIKKKWETVIKKWALKHARETEVEQWVKVNRRFVTLGDELMLPTQAEEEGFEEGKIQVWFFQDTSGSCAGFAKRFFKAARSLPKNRFDIKMHCFDTRVFETTLESGKLYGFGGTSFTCIERYIQRYIKEHNVAPPRAIFIITDGYGDRVYPDKPKTWHWFLSTNYASCIPKESHIYMLKDYE